VLEEIAKDREGPTVKRGISFALKLLE